MSKGEGKHGSIISSRGGTLTQRHGRLIGTEMQRVELIAALTKGAAGLMAGAL